MNEEKKQVLVRLPNYIGDVVLSIPALQALTRAGYQPILVGKPWIHDLLAPFAELGWQTHSYPKKFLDRIDLLRSIRRQGRFSSTRNAIAMPKSFSSALELRLGGFSALGFAGEARSALLGQAWRKDDYALESHRFNALASVFLHGDDSKAIQLPIPRYEPGSIAVDQVAQWVSGDYIAICPFAGGLFAGESKEWPAFPEFSLRLTQQGLRVVVCPGGASELASAKSHYAHCDIIENTSLEQYAAILRGAVKVFANDTGPGHLAAAVGANLVSIQRASAVAKYFPQGHRVSLVQAKLAWPDVENVLALAE